jgi:hypothetical protein
MVEGTAVVEEASTAAGAADFMEVEAGFTAVEVLVAAEATLLSVDARLAVDIGAATGGVAFTAAVASMVAAASTVGGASMAAEVGEEDMVTAGADGAGDLASAGRIGDMAGAIRMATTATIRGITRHTLTLIRILPMDIQKTT